MARVEATGEYALILNREELDVLKDILGHHVFGAGRKREVADGLWAALDPHGTKRNWDYDTGATGGVTFKKEEVVGRL